ncbi:MAG: penicillin-binding protein 1C [Bradymonadaceae bacterium]
MVITYGDGSVAHVFLAPDERWRLNTRLSEVDPDYIEALIALEDKRFYSHLGVDPIAIVRACLSNVHRRRVVSGASTLTMQLVRMVEPRPRTMRSKVVEAFRATQLEMHMSKEEILEAYLRFLPFGRNVEGLEAATLAYFGQDASLLAPDQIATLLSVPQSPNRRFPNQYNGERLEQARNQIARDLLELGALPRGAASANLTDAQAIAQIEAAPVPERMQAFPRDMPHFAWWLRQRYPRAERLHTTVDPSTQRVVERILAVHQGRLEHLGANNASVVLVDHHTGEIKAIVGNLDFDDHRHGGQIAGFDVRRSTGSLLKPFLMAMAIDRGVAGPRHLVEDAPVDYGGYAPENYDGRFQGLVRLEDALGRSLNIPFVNLLQEVGAAQFLSSLQRLGAEGFEIVPGQHGLSVIVGGVEASPMEIARMYTALARGGDPAPMHFIHGGVAPGASMTSSRGELSAESTWLVRQILKGRERPDIHHRGRFGGRTPHYSWKTGTSMGFRDAWTAGSGPSMTAVVWAGNFDNSSNTGIIGQQAAAPLFFDIMEAVDPAPRAQLDTRPMGLADVEVCAYSGHIATSACEHTERVALPRKSVPTRACPFHVHVDLDRATGQIVTPSCRGDREIETRTFVTWPARVGLFMADRGVVSTPMPAYAPGCAPVGRSSGPRVTSPPSDTVLALIPGMPLESQHVPLEAIAQDTSAELSWFASGKFLGTVKAGDRLWWKPEPGEHEFVVMDAEGRSASRWLQVR